MAGGVDVRGVNADQAQLSDSFPGVSRFSSHRLGVEGVSSLTISDQEEDRIPFQVGCVG